MVDSKGTESDMICLPPGKTGNPLCIQEGKQCSRVNLSQFLLKAASTTSSFSLNRKKRPLLEQHYRRSHKTQPVRYFLQFVSLSPLFNIKFSVGPQRARVLHNKIALSLRPSPETLQSYAYYNQARSSFYYIIFAKAKTTTRFVVVGHLV